MFYQVYEMNHAAMTPVRAAAPVGNALAEADVEDHVADLDHAQVMKAFNLADQPVAAFRRDARPAGDGEFWGLPTWAWLLTLFVLVIVMLAQCSDECDEVASRYGEHSTEYRQCRSNASSGRSGSSGGSHGGYSSGGFHK